MTWMQLLDGSRQTGHVVASSQAGQESANSFSTVLIRWTLPGHTENSMPGFQRGLPFELALGTRRQALPFQRSISVFHPVVFLLSYRPAAHTSVVRGSP